MSHSEHSGAHGFLALSESEREKFVRRNFGFLKDVALDMAARGVVNDDGKPYSRATVVRTWYGEFDKPNPIIVAALEFHYRRVRDCGYKRRARSVKAEAVA